MNDINEALRLVPPKSAAAKVLTALRPLWSRDHLLVGIDGCCGSGKTTLARTLAGLLSAPVVHMDDFYTPHARKTPERLSRPGGNADTERFLEEVLTPYIKTHHTVYRPYDCFRDCLSDPVELPDSHLVIIEGSYCLHPSLGQPYDLRFFLRIPPEAQQERILRRNGAEKLKVFLNRWIPLEEAYFSAFSLPDKDCITIGEDELL